MTVDDASSVVGWRYRDRWSVYDLMSPAGILDELNLYWAVTDTSGALTGFVCVEAAARVQGLNADPRFVDVGVGMDPDLVGQGIGPVFGEAALGHVGRLCPEKSMRAVIQAWNVRSQRFALKQGFIDVGELASTQDRRQVHYRILMKNLASHRSTVPAVSVVE
jgi:ribosomal-protein-alanine N-acetyltransferase